MVQESRAPKEVSTCGGIGSSEQCLEGLLRIPRNNQAHLSMDLDLLTLLNQKLNSW